MKKIFFILAIAIDVLPLGSFAASQSSIYYGVWLPYWRGQAGAQNISQNLDQLDEISPFSYKVLPDGSLLDYLHIGSGTWDPWFGAVRDLNIKIIPTIAWFDGDGIYTLLSGAKSRQAQEDAIASLVKTQHFDGIDIDFESMTPATRPYYSLFIQGLATRLHPQKKLLTCTVMARTPAKYIYDTLPANITYPEDYAVLNKYCDEVRVMAYDQGTINLALNKIKGNGTLYAPVTDPDWVKQVLIATLPYINRKKIMLGIPTYGYEYQVSWLYGVTTYERVRAFDYLEAMDRAESLGIQPMRNNADELSFTFTSSTYIHVPSILISTVQSTQPAVLSTSNPSASTTFYVTFPDSISIKNEIMLAKKNGLRGVMLFKADGDIDPLTWQFMN